MQVKLFIHHTLEEIEAAINQWMVEQQAIVKHITQSQCEKQGRFVFVISIFYEQAAADN